MFRTLLYVLLALSLLAVGCNGGSESNRGNSEATDAGCKVGETRHDGCNTCKCTETGWACTARACVDAVPPDADDASSSGDAGCTLGETRKEGCNTCTCTEQGWSCTETGCLDTSSPDANDATQTGDDAGSDDANVEGDAGRFGCGEQTCRVGGEYCKITYPGPRATNDAGTNYESYACKSYGTCGPNPDCSCLQNETSGPGALSIECEKRGAGRFRVEVTYQ